jgi:hypothetical protein
MTTPDDPEHNSPAEGVDLSKGASDAEEPFDPYRFGKPEHPIPAEYAPPGYTGPVVTTPPPPPIGWGPPAPGANPANPFNNPPGTPYAGPGGAAGQGYPPAPGQYPYPPPPPGYYPPPPGYGYGYAPPTGNGKAITSLVLGIGSIVFCFFSFFDALLVVPGLIFGVLAMNEAKARGGSGRGMAVAGLICSIIGAVLATVMSVLLIHAVNQCGGFDNGDRTGFQDCVEQHIF